MNERDKPQLRRLYLGFSDKELEEVEETLTMYTALLVRMVERRHAERRNENVLKGIRALTIFSRNASLA